FDGISVCAENVFMASCGESDHESKIITHDLKVFCDYYSFTLSNFIIDCVTYSGMLFGDFLALFVSIFTYCNRHSTRGTLFNPL
ncbi:MAG: hypothetical protein AABX82_09735, partial [Nanoarchaeota archaeon]